MVPPALSPSPPNCREGQWSDAKRLAITEPKKLAGQPVYFSQNKKGNARFLRQPTSLFSGMGHKKPCDRASSHPAERTAGATLLQPKTKQTEKQRHIGCLSASVGRHVLVQGAALSWGTTAASYRREWRLGHRMGVLTWLLNGCLIDWVVDRLD